MGNSYQLELKHLTGCLDEQIARLTDGRETLLKLLDDESSTVAAVPIQQVTLVPSEESVKQPRYVHPSTPLSKRTTTPPPTSTAMSKLRKDYASYEDQPSKQQPAKKKAVKPNSERTPVKQTVTKIMLLIKQYGPLKVKQIADHLNRSSPDLYGMLSGQVWLTKEYGKYSISPAGYSELERLSTETGVAVEEPDDKHQYKPTTEAI